MSGDGLRNAIWLGYKRWEHSDRAAGPEDYIEEAVRRWLRRTPITPIPSTKEKA